MPHIEKQEAWVYTQELSVIVPIYVKDIQVLEGFSQHYRQLIEDCRIEDRGGKLGIEILVVNSSSETIYLELDNQFRDSGVKHFRPERIYQTGLSDKLNNIHAAMAKVNSQCVALFDDDARPDKTLLIAIKNQLQHFDILRCMVAYDNPNIYDLIDLAGLFVVNVTSPDKQFWTNLCFRSELLSVEQFVDKDVLFDEYAIEQHCKRAGGDFYYLSSPQLSIIRSDRDLRTYIGQRVRYAYENFVYPVRFLLHLSILPIMLLLGFFLNVFFVLAFILLLTGCVMGLAWWGQRRYGERVSTPWVWLYAGLWFWFYPFTSWIAIGCWLTGGIYFGKNKIRKVA